MANGAWGNLFEFYYSHTLRNNLDNSRYRRSGEYYILPSGYKIYIPPNGYKVAMFVEDTFSSRVEWYFVPVNPDNSLNFSIRPEGVFNWVVDKTNNNILYRFTTKTIDLFSFEPTIPIDDVDVIIERRSVPPYKPFITPPPLPPPPPAPPVNDLSGLENAINNLQNLVNVINNAIQNQIRNGTSDVKNTVNASESRVRGTIANAIDTVNQTANQNRNVIETRLSNGFNQTESNLRNVQGNILNNIQSARDGLQITVTNGHQHLESSIQTSTRGINATTERMGSEIEQRIDRLVGEIGSGLEGIVNTILSFIAGLIAELIRVLENLFKPILDFFEYHISQIGEHWKNIIVNPVNSISERFRQIQNVVNRMLEGKYQSWDEFRNDFSGSEVSGEIIHHIFNAAIAVPIILSVFHNAARVYSEPILQLLLEEVRPAKLTADNYVEAMFRGVIDQNRFNEFTGKLGLSQGQADILSMINRPQLGVGDVRTMLLRGIIDNDNHDGHLRRLGFTDGDIFKIKRTYNIIPPIQDIIRFSVREVFTPDIASAYGLFEDFPTDVNQYAKMQGLDEFWTKAYWGAHWDLPSPTMGYEMFHRRIINYEQLVQLLRALDIMPFWREKLIKMAYNPITRVDIRRMYQLGVLTREQVYNRHLDLGYNPDDAEIMTQFVEFLNDDQQSGDSDKIRELSRTTIEDAFINGLITKEIAITRLIELNYTEPDANLLLDIAAYTDASGTSTQHRKDLIKRLNTVIITGYRKRLISYDDARDGLITNGYNSVDADIELKFADLEYEISLKQAVIDAVKEQYVTRVIDKTEANNVFNVYEFTAQEIDTIFLDLDIARNIRGRKPTKAELEKFVQLGIISQEDWYNEMRGLGYSDKYIDMYAIESGLVQ